MLPILRPDMSYFRPFIGGTFANPITQHPTWPWAYLPSGIYQLLKAFPYLLPCVITSVFALVATALGVYVLEEVSLYPLCNFLWFGPYQ